MTNAACHLAEMTTMLLWKQQTTLKLWEMTTMLLWKRWTKDEKSEKIVKQWLIYDRNLTVLSRLQ